MMTLTFFKLYTVYTKKKNRTSLVPYLLVNLFNGQRYISSVKSYGINFFKNTMYMHTIPLIKL